MSPYQQFDTKYRLWYYISVAGQQRTLEEKGGVVREYRHDIQLGNTSYFCHTICHGVASKQT